mgnify:CR=1 FL=1
MKTIPLGHSAGQRLLVELGARIPAGGRAGAARSPTRTSRPSRPGLRWRRRDTRRSTFDYSVRRDHARDATVASRGSAARSARARPHAATLALPRLRERATSSRSSPTTSTPKRMRNSRCATTRARAERHHRRRDRRLPAYGDPRGRIDQPRSGRSARISDSAISTSFSSKAAATILPRRSRPSLRPDALRDRRRRRRQDSAQGGPGITQSDLLVINKIDLAPLVGASLEDTRRAQDAR